MNEGAEKQSRMARLLLGKEAFLVYVLVTLGTIFFVAPREVRVQHLLAMLVREQIVQTINPAREAFNLSPFAFKLSSFYYDLIVFSYRHCFYSVFSY